MNEALFYFGDTLRALDDKGRVGGYSVRFTDSDHRDLYGDYFTKDTYLGAHEGNGVDVLFHHGLPLYTTRRMSDEQKKALEAFRNHIFSNTAKSKKDDVGLFTEVVLDMADEYEKAVYGLVKAGKLGWSSGSTWHMVKRTDDGQITRWPIIEISLTPQPAEKLNRVATLKTIESLKFVPLGDDADDDDEQPMSEAEKLVSSFKALDIDTHSRLAVSAVKDLAARFRSKYEARLKDKRALSEAYRQNVASVLEQWKAASADLQTLLTEATATTNDAEKRATESEYFRLKYRHAVKRGNNAQNLRTTVESGDDVGNRRHDQEQHR